MDNKLIQKLTEKDLFQAPSDDDLQHREANRPPNVLEGGELHLNLMMIVTDDIIMVLRDKRRYIETKFFKLGELMDCIVDGSPLVSPPVDTLSTSQLLNYMKVRYSSIPIYSQDTNFTGFGKWIVELVNDSFGEDYTELGHDE